MKGGVRGVIFAGGGTGGHIFPGLAIAEQLAAHGQRAGMVIRCEFAVSKRPLDAEILRSAGAAFTVIPAEPLVLRPRGLVRFVSSWGKAVRASRAMIERMRAECPGGVAVLAMGGFVAAPFVQAARVERVPITLVNLDAVPGRANRWIARHAARVFSAAEIDGRPLSSASGVVVVPPIVRAAAIGRGGAAMCRRELGMEPHGPTLMVTGASQGARSINGFAVALVAAHADELRCAGWQIVHQTGRGEDDRVREAYAELGLRAIVQPFFDRMGLLWGAADVAVSRSGAGSVAEAWANTVPTIFMPYPYHKDQHQKHNAQALEAAGAAIIRDDLIEPGANVASIGPVLMELVRDPGKRGAMRGAFARLGPADGAVRIAESLLVRSSALGTD